MPAATELLLGMWLKEQKTRKCARIVGDWRRGLLSRGDAANDNLTDEDRGERVKALQSLDKLCRACDRDCPMHPTVVRREVI